jgi:protein tyrosine/serine phosphatase
MRHLLRSYPSCRIVGALIGVLLIVSLAAGSWALGLQLTGNIHTVENGILYRSAQLNGQRLSDVLTAYGIRSVINLRGGNHGDWWYRDELEITAANGVAHFEVYMAATNEPSVEIVSRLMEIIRTAPRPILIHCNSGSDRAGLASALFERFLRGRSAEMASAQLSFRYGHFPWLGSATVAMDTTFWRLASNRHPDFDLNPPN